MDILFRRRGGSAAKALKEVNADPAREAKR